MQSASWMGQILTSSLTQVLSRVTVLGYGLARLYTSRTFIVKIEIIHDLEVHLPVTQRFLLEVC